jgi:hypothetical protein
VFQLSRLDASMRARGPSTTSGADAGPNVADGSTAKLLVIQGLQKPYELLAVWSWWYHRKRSAKIVSLKIRAVGAEISKSARNNRFVAFWAQPYRFR